MASSAPKIRDLQSLIKTQQAALKPQLDLVDQSITANDQSGTAQVAGLDAAKTNAFGNITQQSQDNGMFFSGFTPDAEAKYTGSTYLPALAQLQSTIASTRAGLLGKKVDLQKGAFDVATQQAEQDRAVLADWNKMTAQQKFDASESQKQRVFTAQQSEKDRAFTASQNAASRAASAADKGPTVADAVKNVGGFLKSKVGGDGKVSPDAFQAGRIRWVAAGGDASDYDDVFKAYVNNSHKQDYFLD